MALENSDVFVVQKQSGQKPVCKVSAVQLTEYLQTASPINYKGAGDFTNAGDDPSPNENGDLWINNALNTGAFAWTGGTGTVNPGDRAVWDGTQWQVMSQGGTGNVGVETVRGSDPIEVDSSDATSPIVSVKTATTSQIGVVTLADASDVASGATGKVVTADQLKDTNDAISNAGGGTVTNVTGVDPIEVANNTSTPSVSIKDSTIGQKGAVALADYSSFSPAEATTAATPEYVDSFYLIKDFSSLDDA